jgi:hypothetical protein
MARIHTHYDNLKVSRKAPQEVIRAAYKALSQKYHPDKNPGDEKAARIMAILNSAYGTLADPTRRREHDDWIAAEEWEIEWLESTRADEERELLRHEPHPDDEAPAPAPRSPWRSARTWLSVGLGLVLGGAAGVLLMSQTKVLPAALAKTEGRATPVAAAPPAPPPPAPEARNEPLDSWAVSQAHVPEGGQQAPQVKALAVTQLVVPARALDCDTELHTLVAPNGEPWPAASGYLDGFPRGNQGEDMQIVVDNGANNSPVLVKVYDLDRRANVRQVYVLANDSLTVDKLAAGKYEVRYQNINVGGTGADCVVKRKREPTQAAVAP